MNVIKNKIFGYSRFRDAGEIQRLGFNVKFSKSAYQDEKLHPALEALLYYIYTEGSIDPMCPFVLSNAEDLMVHMLLAKLKAGGWKSLDERIITPVTAMAAIREYLKALPKSLWSNTKAEDWKALSRSVRRRDRGGSAENKGIAKMEALKSVNYVHNFNETIVTRIIVLQTTKKVPSVARQFLNCKQCCKKYFSREYS
ncbi:hypothetical protein AVEN_230279-1 [Araneus ventricosus]|uniref:Uncharacterized protein n=1 Tax=Araneus ventricosus TaxID=182803 RepID=A0A4Y2LB72_ARAVE|nr:hypothetical protein AVEN_230279-1 [Araneus ventricosus]